jgi:hypothetical protein
MDSGGMLMEVCGGGGVEIRLGGEEEGRMVWGGKK